MASQEQCFFDGEGDAWYKRNQTALTVAGHFDWPLALIDQLGDKAKIAAVAELGCANGYRLEALRQRGIGNEHVGVDVSAEAIAQGSRHFPALELLRAPLSNVPLEKTFDLVIVNYVLHWIDRERLVRTIGEIDRLVKDGGTLVIGDFLPDAPSRRQYHHRPEGGVFTFKQDYAAIFSALGTYREIARVCYNHDAMPEAIQAAASETRAGCCVLRKSLSGYYAVQQ